jgi:CRISPR-associated protein Cas5d
MFERRAKNGQCFHRPYLGCREFACAFSLVEQGDGVLPIAYSDDLGWMLYDMDYSDKDNPKPEFFRARLENGVVNTDRRVVEVRS